MTFCIEFLLILKKIIMLHGVPLKKSLQPQTFETISKYNYFLNYRVFILVMFFFFFITVSGRDVTVHKNYGLVRNAVLELWFGMFLGKKQNKSCVSGQLHL